MSKSLHPHIHPLPTPHSLIPLSAHFSISASLISLTMQPSHLAALFTLQSPNLPPLFSSCRNRSLRAHRLLSGSPRSLAASARPKPLPAVGLLHLIHKIGSEPPTRQTRGRSQKGQSVMVQAELIKSDFDPLLAGP